MCRAVFTLALAMGAILPAMLRADRSLEIDSPVAAAEDAFQESMAKAENRYLQARIEAHSTLLVAVAEAKRAAISSGDLHLAEYLAEREDQIECELQAERTAALRIEHELAPVAKLEVRGEDFALKMLRNGATAYSNRDYKWAHVPEALQGWAYTQIDGGDTPEFRIEVVQPGVAYVMAESLELTEHGWLHRPDLAFPWFPGRDSMSVFTKQVKAGQVLDVPHIGWTGTMILLPPRDSEDR